MENRVKFSLGYTRNMKEFESLRIDIGIETDKMEGETTAQALQRAKDFVSGELFAELDVVEQQLRASRGK